MEALLAPRTKVAAENPGAWHPVLWSPRYLLRQGHGHRLAQLVQTAVNPIPPPLFYHFVRNGGSLRTEVCTFRVALLRALQRHGCRGVPTAFAATTAAQGPAP